MTDPTITTEFKKAVVEQMGYAPSDAPLLGPVFGIDLHVGFGLSAQDAAAAIHVLRAGYTGKMAASPPYSITQLGEFIRIDVAE